MLGCGPEVQTARGNGVIQITYDHCAKGGEVEYYRVRGLGHIWPGGTRADCRRNWSASRATASTRPTSSGNFSRRIRGSSLTLKPIAKND